MKPIFTEADFAIKKPNVKHSWQCEIRDFWFIYITYTPEDERYKAGYAIQIDVFNKGTDFLMPYPERFKRKLGDLLIILNTFLEAIKATKEEVVFTLYS